jgi:hypothetical protein
MQWLIYGTHRHRWHYLFLVAGNRLIGNYGSQRYCITHYYGYLYRYGNNIWL